MSVALDGVVELLAGLLSDPGTSSKDHQKLVAKAVDLYKEADFQVKRENERLNAAVPPLKTPVAGGVAVKPAEVTPKVAK